MYEWHGYGGGMMWIFWILLIVLVLWVIKVNTGEGRNRDSSVQNKSALDILDERYAKGEIERDEFEQKRRDLNGK